MTPDSFSDSELRYRRLFEAAHDGIIIVDPVSRHILDVNPFLEQFLGFPHQEFVGKELFEIGLLKDEAASQAAFHELQKNGIIRYENLPLQTKDGRRVDVEFVSNLYQEGDHQVIQCNVRDISVRKKAERALRDIDSRLSQYTTQLEEVVGQRTSELQRSNAQLETFVYSIAHDLRAPLRAMQGFAQLLAQDYAGSLDQKGRHYVDVISTSAQVMDHMLADLLTFSRINQQKIELVPISLESVVQGAVGGCDEEIREGHAVIELVPPWPMVLAHLSTLRQVLINLIGNAVKFVSEKTPHVRIRAEERPERMIRIWIEDNGIGIPAEFQERIFQVFHRLHTTAYPGTGIGLAIVQKGVERMGGKVGLESTPGEGSRFWIDLSTPGRASTGSKRENERTC